MEVSDQRDVPVALTPQNKTLVHIEMEPEWVWELVWTFWKN